MTKLQGLPLPQGVQIATARDSRSGREGVIFSAKGSHSGEDRQDPALINQVLQETVDRCIASDAFPSLTLHSEHFSIIGASPAAASGNTIKVERFASSIFGIATRGAHMTAYLPASESHPLRVWVARRSRHIFAHPGLLDSTVAGGVKADHTPWDCILAESVEEASLPVRLVQSRAKSVGAITLANINPRSGQYHSEVLYVYDMDLSAAPGADGIDVTLSPGDDEVEEFILMDCEELIKRMLNHEFKPNVCPVMVDFLIRHGIVTSENEPDYTEICSRLHRRLPVSTTPL